jgi:2-hydroxychromene-2-carboxylate isomerase
MEKGSAVGTSPALEFWFGFASPYSYLAASRIETLVSAKHIRILWRPFLLGPIFKRRASNPSPFQEAGREEKRYRRRDVERLCELYGLPLSWPSSYPRGRGSAWRKSLRSDYARARNIA